MSEFRVDFKADTANVTKGIKDVQGGLKGISGIAKGVGASFATMMAPLLAVTAALGGIAFVANGIKGAIDFGGDMADLSSKTGIAVKDLVILTEAFKLAGMEGADLGKIVNGLSAKLDSPTPKILETMEMLGLSMKNIKDLPIGERFQVVGEAIGNLSSATDRANASQALFGRTMGNNLLVLFNSNGAIEDAKNSVGGLAGSMQKYATDLEMIGDAFDSISTKMRQFFVALVGQNIDKLKSVADLIMGIDLTKAGEAVGKFVSKAVDIADSLIDSFNDGRLLQALSNEIKLAWLEAKPTILDTFSKGAEIFANVFVTVLKNASSLFSSLEGWSNVSLDKTIEDLTMGMIPASKNGSNQPSGYERPQSEIDEIERLRGTRSDKYTGPGLMKSFSSNLEASMQDLQSKLDAGFFKPIEKFVGKLKGEWALTPENMQKSIDMGKAPDAYTGLSSLILSLRAIKGGGGFISDKQSTGSARIYTSNPTVDQQKETNSILKRMEVLLARNPTATSSNSNTAIFGAP